MSSVHSPGSRLKGPPDHIRDRLECARGSELERHPQGVADREAKQCASEAVNGHIETLSCLREIAY